MDLSVVDMTLMLGADSFMRQRLPGADNAPHDPVGSQCLSNFVDLVVNSEACFLLLPSSDDYPTPLALARRVSALKRLRNCAAVKLNSTTEKRVVREFRSLLQDYDWLSQWFKSHWGNPLAPRHQSPALGRLAKRFATISDEGWATLRQYFGIAELNHLEPLARSMPEQAYLKSDITRAGGCVAYQYAYAFDTFRRGWQYAASSDLTKRQIWYCPHRIRQRALEGGSNAWLERNRDEYWSWGRCIVNLVKSSPTAIQPEMVADWVNGIIESNPPRWVAIPQSITTGVDNRESRLAIRDLVETVEVVARSARIPRSLLTQPTLPLKLGRVAFEHVMEELRVGTVESILHILPVKTALERVTYNASEWAKDAVNFLYKRTFGYPGLVSQELRMRAAPPKHEVYLL
jgi:hypothetical protein